VSKKTKKAEKKALLKPAHPIADRRVFVPIKDGITTTPQTLLSEINNALASVPTFKLAPFITASRSSERLTLVVAPHLKATDYSPFLGIISNALNGPMCSDTAVAGTSTTRFVLHGVDTSFTPEYALRTIQASYPNLAVTAVRWLTTAAQRVDIKSHSSMVITTNGKLTITDLGARHIFLFGDRCRIAPYHNYNPQTRCARCLEFGHSSPLCKAETPTCSVCAGSHLSKKHPCKVPLCKGGADCSHPPLACKACGPGHKFSTGRSCKLVCPPRRPSTPVESSTEEMSMSP